MPNESEGSITMYKGLLLVDETQGEGRCLDHPLYAEIVEHIPCDTEATLEVQIWAVDAAGHLDIEEDGFFFSVDLFALLAEYCARVQHGTFDAKRCCVTFAAEYAQRLRSYADRIERQCAHHGHFEECAH